MTLADRLIQAEALAALVLAVTIGCSSPSEKLVDVRRAASIAFNEAGEAFANGDYATADQKFSTALQPGGLMADQYCEATVKRAVCWSAAGKHSEAHTELDNLGPGASNPAEIFAARSFIFKKQGKLADSRAALAKARRYNRTVQEFKD